MDTKDREKKPIRTRNREQFWSSGRTNDRSYVEANGALLRSPVAGVLGRVEARREVAAADEAMQAAGVKVGQLPDEAARPREPLLHRRQTPPDLHARDDDVAHACATLAKVAVAGAVVYSLRSSSRSSGAKPMQVWTETRI